MLVTSNSIKQFKQYTPLAYELISKDLKVKYRRSVLGYLWSLLHPLMMMVIMTIVFSKAFRFDIQYYPLYVISGNVLFTFFNDSTNYAMYSIIDNAALIKKVYIPKYILPFSNILSSFVTLGFSMAAVLLVMIFMRVPFHWTILLFPLPLAMEFLFCTGVGLILASTSVYFRDINHLYGVLTLAWMYATPIFYPVEVLPDSIRMLENLNPMFHYVTMFRSLVIQGVVPDPITWLIALACSVVALIAGLATFRALQRNFILYL